MGSAPTTCMWAIREGEDSGAVVLMARRGKPVREGEAWVETMQVVYIVAALWCAVILCAVRLEGL